jgi:hypothetical protein
VALYAADAVLVVLAGVFIAVGVMTSKKSAQKKAVNLGSNAEKQ